MHDDLKKQACGRAIALIFLVVYIVLAVRGAFFVDNTNRTIGTAQVSSEVDWNRCKRDWKYAKSTKTLAACQIYLNETGEYETIASWVKKLLAYYCAHPPQRGTDEYKIFIDELKCAAEYEGVPEKGYRNVANFASQTYSSDAPLRINTDGSAHYLVRFIDLIRRQTAMDYFIPAGQSANITIPIGTYEILYTSGHTWYGDDLLFGPEGRFSKAERTFLFELNHTYTLTLYRVQNGNLPTSCISPERFGLDTSLKE